LDNIFLWRLHAEFSVESGFPDERLFFLSEEKWVNLEKGND
jgi:hypothetical protein